MTRPLSQPTTPGRLATEVFETEHIDLLDLYRRVSGRASCFYRQSADGVQVLGIGTALSVETADATMAELYQRLVERLADVDGDRSKLTLFGWTAFDTLQSAHSHTDTPDWTAYARQQLLVPQVLLRSDDGSTQAVVFAEDVHKTWKTWQTRFKRSVEILAPSSMAPGSMAPQIDWLDEGDFRRGVGLVTDERIAPKVVLARRAYLTADAPIDTSMVLRRLASAYPTCSVFALSPGTDSPYPVFAGATPETLACVDEGRVETMALAGTSRNEAGRAPDLASEQELLSSQKDLDEHRFVLDMIVEALEPICMSVAAEPEPHAHRLANVSHLMTKISGELSEGIGLAEVVDALHPTPAVCGTPRNLAMRLIAELEGFDRGLYAGAFGSMDLEGNGRFDVALRCGLIDGARALLFAGAGITADSDVDVEVSETRSKFAPLLDAICKGM